MSGGHFDYQQRQIGYIIESIEEEIEKNGQPFTEDEKKDSYYGLNDDAGSYHYEYPEDIINEFKKGIYYLQMAGIYAQRIDWLLSGDDGEDSFRKRLLEDLEELKQNN